VVLRAEAKTNDSNESDDLPATMWERRYSHWMPTPGAGHGLYILRHQFRRLVETDSGYNSCYGRELNAQVALATHMRRHRSTPVVSVSRRSGPLTIQYRVPGSLHLVPSISGPVQSRELLAEVAPLIQAPCLLTFINKADARHLARSSRATEGLRVPANS
jgi:hypothetical protein